MAYSYYEVTAGDQLFRILRRHYGDATFLKDRAKVMALVTGHNAAIRNIDYIRPGQVIVLPDLSLAERARSLPPPAPQPSALRDLTELADGLQACSAPGRDFISGLDLSAVYATGAGSFLGEVDKRMRAAVPHMKRIVEDYQTYRGGGQSLAAYSRARQQALGQIGTAMSPLYGLVYPDRRHNEILRIDRDALGAARTRSIRAEIRRIDGLALGARTAGRVLTAVSVAQNLQRLGAAQTHEEGALILLDIAAGLSGGALGSAAGTALAAALLVTPAGWVGIAFVIGGSVAGAMTAQAITAAVARHGLRDRNDMPFNPATCALPLN